MILQVTPLGGELRSIDYHPVIQPVHNPAAGVLKKRGEEGVNETAGCPDKQFRSKAKCVPHMLEIAFVDTF